MRSVAFSDDGNYIISGSDDKTIKLWDAKNPEEEAIYTFRGHAHHVLSVAISSDGKTIVSGSADGKIKLWDAKKWENWEDWVKEACGWLRSDQGFALPASQKESEQEKQALEGAVKVCMNHGGWETKEKAKFLVSQGLAIVTTKEDIEDIKKAIEEPMAKFKQAQELDENLDIKKDENQVINHLHTKLSAASQKEAKLGNLEKVKANLENLEKLKKLNPNNNSDIDLEELRKQLMRRIAQAWIEEAVELAIDSFDKRAKSKLREVIKFIKKEKLNDETQKDEVSLDASSWNQLCRFGSIYGYAKDVLFACDKAVNTEEKANFKDSRGLARALTNDRQGAIKDFQAFVDDESKDEIYTNKRKEWIKALDRGDEINEIFTEKVLNDLKTESTYNFKKRQEGF